MQRLDRPLLRGGGGGIGALAQRLPGIAHRGIGLRQALRHFAGQVAELLHQLSERPAQGLLHALVGLPFGAPVRRLFLGLAGNAVGSLVLCPALRTVQQAALPRDHVLQRPDLLLTPLALLGPLLSRFLRRLGIGGLAVLQLVEHLLQLCHALFGVLHPPVLGRIARGFRQPVQVTSVHLHGLRIDLLHGAVALRLLQHRLQAVADGLFEIPQLAVQIRQIGRVRLLCRAFQRIARGLPCIFQRAGGAVDLPVLQLHRQFPHALLGRRHGAGLMIAHQNIVDPGEVQERAEVALERLGLQQHLIQHRQDLVPVHRMQGQPPAQLDQHPGNRVLEIPFRQGEADLRAFAGLSEGIASDQPAAHGQPGPGMGGQVLHRDPLRLGRTVRGQRQGQFERRRRRFDRLVQHQLGLQRNHAVIVLDPPGQA